MSIQIAILGLNREGISAALALGAKHEDILCKGWDPDAEKCAAADASKIFHPICKDLKTAVKGAALLLVTLAPEEFKSALEELKTVASPGVVLVNLSSLQALPAQWIDATLGKDAPYLSLLPALNAAYLQESEDEREQPHADLFSGGRIYISAPPRAETRLLDLAVDLAVLLGGKPIFADAHEVDGLAAANLLLPELAVSALMGTLSGQPSWRDGRQVAGSALAEATLPLADLSVEVCAQTALADSANTLRLLDSLAVYLRHMRQSIQDRDQGALEDLLGESQAARLEWLQNRQKNAAAGQQATSIPNEKKALENFLNLNR